MVKINYGWLAKDDAIERIRNYVKNESPIKNAITIYRKQHPEDKDRYKYNSKNSRLFSVSSKGETTSGTITQKTDDGEIIINPEYKQKNTPIFLYHKPQNIVEKIDSWKFIDYINEKLEKRTHQPKTIGNIDLSIGLRSDGINIRIKPNVTNVEDESNDQPSADKSDSTETAADKNIKTDSKLKSLYDCLETPKDCTFEYCIGCTYTASGQSIADLTPCFGINLNSERMKEYCGGSYFNIFTDKYGFKGSEKFLNCVKPVDLAKCNEQGQNAEQSTDMTSNQKLDSKKLDSKKLHSKVYFAAYRKKSDKTMLYRIVVTSANLTNEDELNCYISADIAGSELSKLSRSRVNKIKKIKNNTETNTNTYLKTFLKNVSIIFNKVCKDYKKDYKLINIMPGYNYNHKNVFSQEFSPEIVDCDRAMIISPFITGPTVNEIFNTVKAKRKILVSREDMLTYNAEQLNKDKDKDKDKDIELYSTYEECNHFGNIAALHAKIYIFEKGDIRTVFLGSANATSTAFNRNIETLVKFTEKKSADSAFDIEALIGKNGWFAPFVLPEKSDCESQKNVYEKRRNFENLCLQIASTLEFKDNKYTLDMTKDTEKAITKVNINGKEYSNVICRKNYRHPVSLAFFPKDNDILLVSLTVIVEPDANKLVPVPVDDIQIEEDIDRLIANTLNIKRESNSTGKKNGSNSDNSNQGLIGDLWPEIIMKAQLRDEAIELIKSIDDVLAKIPENTSKKLCNALERGKCALEKVWIIKEKKSENDL